MFWNFFFLLLSFENSLHILDISPLSGKWFANIFSLFVACLFMLLKGPFAEKTFLILTCSISVFPFIVCVFDVRSQNSLSSTRSQRYFLILCKKSFVVLHFIFQTLIYSGLIFS